MVNDPLDSRYDKRFELESDRPLKALVAAYAVSPYRGSEPGNGWHLTAALAATGIEVHVITGVEWRAEIEAHAPRAVGLTFHYVSHPAPRRGFRSGQRSVYADYVAWQRRCLEAAVALDAEHDFDVAHHLNWGSLFWGSTLSRLGKPFVFGPIGGGEISPKTLREWFGPSWRREAQRNWALRRALRLNPWARRTLRGADLVLATNRETAALSRALGATRVELCLDTAVSPEAIVQKDREAPRGSAPTVLWVGRNLPLKGVALALRAFAHLRRARPSAELVMLGGGLQDEAITRQIEALRLVGAVRRLGHVPLPSVIERYDTSSVMLFSSIRESFGAQVLEAMSRGLPVVALDIHGVADFMPAAAGVKVPLQRGEGLAVALGEGVARLLTDPELWQRASRAARAAAARHTWDRRAQELAGDFVALASGRHAWECRSAHVRRRRLWLRSATRL
jgi:glycosyltransferase involved in cell wall biosynthesis